jgi:hypothetical protein
MCSRYLTKCQICVAHIAHNNASPAVFSLLPPISPMRTSALTLAATARSHHRRPLAPAAALRPLRSGRCASLQPSRAGRGAAPALSLRPSRSGRSSPLAPALSLRPLQPSRSGRCVTPAAAPLKACHRSKPAVAPGGEKETLWTRRRRRPPGAGGGSLPPQEEEEIRTASVSPVTVRFSPFSSFPSPTLPFSLSVCLSLVLSYQIVP